MFSKQISFSLLTKCFRRPDLACRP